MKQLRIHILPSSSKMIAFSVSEDSEALVRAIGIADGTPIVAAQRAAGPRPRLNPGHVGVDAQRHARIAVAHLRGGDRRVLAQLGAG